LTGGSSRKPALSCQLPAVSKTGFVERLDVGAHGSEVNRWEENAVLYFMADVSDHSAASR